MNRIHRTDHTNTKGYRSKLALFLAMLLLIGYVMVPGIEAKADSLSLRVSASSVRIGDTVTVSITVPAGVSATVNLTYPSSLFSFVSASETANSNGGTVSMTLGGYGGTNATTTGTVKFRAKAAGSATFSASAPVAGNQEGDQVNVGGASASVSVKNEANDNNSGNGSSGNGNSGNGSSGNGSSGNGSSGNGSSGNGDSGNDADDDNRNKSADNSLASLTLSKGTLSPAFKYNVVNYTAKVDYDVTSVVVSAKVSNNKAKIESVTGGENLVVGANRIQIVVKAENGVTATYTVTVTRAAEGEQVTDPADSDQQEEPEDPSEQCYMVNGEKRFPVEQMPEGIEQEGFESAEVTLWDKTYPCLKDTFAGGSLYLLYLVDENGENGALYLVQSVSLYEACDYVRLSSEAAFIVVLPDGDGNAPEGYTMGTYNLVEKGMVDAWFAGDEREFALVYAVNSQGVRGWYQLDLSELTYMRYVAPTVTIQIPQEDTQTIEPPVADNTELDRLQKQNRLIIGVAAIIVLILLIVIVLILVLRKNRSWEDADDSFFEEELQEEYAGEALGEMLDEQPKKRYDRSVFAEENRAEPDLTELEKNLAQEIATEFAQEPDQTSDDDGDTGSARDAAREPLPGSDMIADIDAIADPEPMQTISTHKDDEDDDLEYIDL